MHITRASVVDILEQDELSSLRIVRSKDQLRASSSSSSALCNDDQDDDSSQYIELEFRGFEIKTVRLEVASVVARERDELQAREGRLEAVHDGWLKV